MNKRDQILALVHQVNFRTIFRLVKERFLYLQDQFRLLIQLSYILHDPGARRNILIVVKKGAFSRALLHQNGVPVMDQLLNCFWDCRNAALPVHNLLWNTDNHKKPSSLYGFLFAKPTLFVPCGLFALICSNRAERNAHSSW